VYFRTDPAHWASCLHAILSILLTQNENEAKETSTIYRERGLLLTSNELAWNCGSSLSHSTILLIVCLQPLQSFCWMTNPGVRVEYANHSQL
jgi:hypothetical protein